MVLTGRHIEQLTEAMLAAFPQNADLELLVQFELSTRLNWLVDTNAGLRQQVVDLITWAIDQRRIHELVCAAGRRRPDNPLLRRFCEEMAAAQGVAAPLSEAVPPSPTACRTIPGHDGFALYCNRSKQWELVQAPAFEAASELVFVPGAFERGHEYFVRRIKRRLGLDPKSIIEVGWPPAYLGPDSRGELLEMLANSLGEPPASGGPDELAQRIARALATRLCQRNMIIVHATLSMDFRAGILAYYTDWLPDILRRAQRLGSSLRCLKCYQAIEWLDLPWYSRLRSAFVRRLSSHDVERGTGELDAKTLIRKIVERQPPDVLRARCLPDLEDITDEDLVDLCNKWAVTDPQDQERLVQTCAAAKTSCGKLKIVDAVFPSLLPHQRTAAYS
jgi:hypothetical protein